MGRIIASAPTPSLMPALATTRYAPPPVGSSSCAGAPCLLPHNRSRFLPLLQLQHIQRRRPGVCGAMRSTDRDHLLVNRSGQKRSRTPASIATPGPHRGRATTRAAANKETLGLGAFCFKPPPVAMPPDVARLIAGRRRTTRATKGEDCDKPDSTLVSAAHPSYRGDPHRVPGDARPGSHGSPAETSVAAVVEHEH